MNERAAHTTRATAIQNHVHPVEPILTNFTDALLPRLRHSVDILIFNPPYVVTADAEVGSHAIDAAWAGGRDGRVVVDRLIESGTVGELLSDRGVFYLVAIRQNRPDELQRMLEEKHGFESTVAMDRRAGIEHLYVLKFWRRGRIVV